MRDGPLLGAAAVSDRTDMTDGLEGVAWCAAGAAIGRRETPSAVPSAVGCVLAFAIGVEIAARLAASAVGLIRPEGGRPAPPSESPPGHVRKAPPHRGRVAIGNIAPMLPKTEMQKADLVQQSAKKPIGRGAAPQRGHDGWRPGRS